MKQFINFVYNFFKFYKNTKKQNDIFTHNYTNISNNCYDREEFLVGLSQAKKVLHFGFLDSPFCEKKIVSKELLHLKLIEESKEVFGVDIDEETLHKYRSLTSDYNNGICDITKDIDNISDFAKGYEVILFPEVLEHLLDVGSALKNLYHICEVNNAKLCITVPNAFFIMGFCAAISGREIVHPNHYYYFSPSTLFKLLSDTGFKNIQIDFYISSDMKNMPGLVKNGIIATCTA